MKGLMWHQVDHVARRVQLLWCLPAPSHDPQLLTPLPASEPSRVGPASESPLSESRQPRPLGRGAPHLLLHRLVTPSPGRSLCPCRPAGPFLLTLPRSKEGSPSITTIHSLLSAFLLVCRLERKCPSLWQSNLLKNPLLLVFFTTVKTPQDCQLPPTACTQLRSC